MDTPTLSPCPVCGAKPGDGTRNRDPGYSFYCSGRFHAPHALLSGGYCMDWAGAAAAWNEAVASYRPPAPEPEPAAPRRVSPTIHDVRLALWDAYKRLGEMGGLDCVKDAEGLCEVEYPNLWTCDTPEEFTEPCCLMIYAYALGPNRRHYIVKGKRKRRLREGEWESPDIFGYALELIAEWLAENGAEGVGG